MTLKINNDYVNNIIIPMFYSQFRDYKKKSFG